MAGIGKDVMRRTAIAAVAVAGLTASPVGTARADDVARMGRKRFTVTVRVFDPNKGPASGHDYVLPVDSPDAEHAASSTMANAVSFTIKVENGKALPVAFVCMKVEPR